MLPLFSALCIFLGVTLGNLLWRQVMYARRSRKSPRTRHDNADPVRAVVRLRRT
jgi:hypothetical protein